MTDLISKDKVLDILKNLGGCDAKDEYSKGWDDAIDAAYNDVGNLPSVELFTREELCMLSFGLGVASAFIELKSINFNSIMEKSIECWRYNVMLKLPRPMPLPKAEDMAKCTTVVEIKD